MSYFEYVGAEFRKGWWNALVIVVFTIARLIFGWSWFKAGWGKLTGSEGGASWIGGKFEAEGMMKGMVSNLQHSHGSDPIHLNNLLIWFTNNIFLHMGGLVDFLVVAFEILVGIFVFFGFAIVWAMIAALFLTLQYAAGGAANSFGYNVVEIVWFRFPRNVGLIGVDGYLRYRKENKLHGSTDVKGNNAVKA